MFHGAMVGISVFVRLIFIIAEGSEPHSAIMNFQAHKSHRADTFERPTDTDFSMSFSKPQE